MENFFKNETERFLLKKIILTKTFSSFIFQKLEISF